MTVLDVFKKFDAYPKTLDDFRIKTFSGGTITVISGIVMILLFASEIQDYLTPGKRYKTTILQVRRRAAVSSLKPKSCINIQYSIICGRNLKSHIIILRTSFMAVRRRRFFLGHRHLLFQIVFVIW